MESKKNRHPFIEGKEGSFQNTNEEGQEKTSRPKSQKKNSTRSHKRNTQNKSQAEKVNNKKIQKSVEAPKFDKESEDKNTRFSSYSENEKFETREEETSSLSSEINEMGDDQLVKEIQAAIDYEPFLSDIAENIAITVESKVVTLEGVVLSQEQKGLAGEKASEFVGSEKVFNKIEVLE
jgi:osmotically-inducible protein OsmY